MAPPVADESPPVLPIDEDCIALEVVPPEPLKPPVLTLDEEMFVELPPDPVAAAAPEPPESRAPATVEVTPPVAPIPAGLLLLPQPFSDATTTASTSE